VSKAPTDGRAAGLDVRALAPGCLAGRRALVTGAGSGIGRGIAHRLAELGGDVVGVGRRPEPLAETAASIARLHQPGSGTFSWHTLDVRHREAAATLVAEISEPDGLHLLVNNAGGQFIAPARRVSDRAMAAVLDLNLTAIAALTRAARSGLARAGGAVVTISLSSPERGIPGLVHSAPARAAIIALTRQLAGEWRRDGIALYALAPGTVLTEGMRGEMPPEDLRRTLATTPLGSPTTVDEIAEWVAALGAGVGPLPAGTVVQLDGGAGIHGVTGLIP
jgi:citronellol/citronellal dehydrogenase